MKSTQPPVPPAPQPGAQSRWRASLEEFRSVRTVTFCGVMCALAMVLGAVTTINLGPYLKIGLSGIPNQIVDYLLGPAVGGVFAGALEVIKFMMKPDGVYFPGFTLSAVLAAVIYGAVLYRRPPTVLRIAIAQVLVKLIVNIGCNTLWLVILYQKAAWAILPARITANAIRLPGDILVMYLILKTVERSILPILRRPSVHRAPKD